MKKEYKLFVGAYDHKLGPVCVSPEDCDEWMSEYIKKPSALIQDGLNTKSEVFTINYSNFLVQVHKFKISDQRLRGGVLRCALFCLVPVGMHLLPRENMEEIITEFIRLAGNNDNDVRCEDCSDYLTRYEAKLNEQLPGSIGYGNINHKIRDLLNSILGYAELIKEGMVGEVSEEQKNFLDYIIKYSKEIVKILESNKVESIII